MVLWALEDRRRLTEPVLRALDGGATQVVVSAVCIWEIAIKAALGKLNAPDDLPAALEEYASYILPVSAAHAWAVRDLPAHHADPFDRLLVAQARAEDALLVTADPRMARYDVQTLW